VQLEHPGQIGQIYPNHGRWILIKLNQARPGTRPQGQQLTLVATLVGQDKKIRVVLVVHISLKAG
jgi:hypothetical protein